MDDHFGLILRPRGPLGGLGDVMRSLLEAKMTPNGYKKASRIRCRFCVTFLVTFGGILATKMELSDFFFGLKAELFQKMEILSKHHTGHTDSWFGLPPKSD